MGAANTRVANPAKKALREYYKWHVKSNSAEDEVRLKVIFDLYDDGKKGHLSEADAERYLLDLMELVSCEPLKDEKNIHKLASEQDKQDFMRDFLLCLVHDMDPKIAGKVEFEKLIRPSTFWKKFAEVNSMGSGQRQFTRRLRNTKLQAEKKDSSKPSSDFKKKAALTESGASYEVKQTNEAEKAFDAALEEHHNEEKLDKKILQGSSKTPLEISELREAQVHRIADLLNIEPGTAQTLLVSVQWNEDQLIHEYFEQRDTLLKRVGLTASGVDHKTKPLVKSSDQTAISGDSFECSVCLDDVPRDKFTSLPSCKHAFCNDCWRANLELQIKDGNTLVLHCMHSGCKDLVPNTIVTKLVSDEYAKKFASFLGKSYVNSNAQLKPCPAPNCENALTEFTIEGFIKVGVCKCGYRFCWDCSHEAHPPISCHLLKKWEDIVSADPDSLGWLSAGGMDMQTLKWMRENTKDCPKCGVNVQKNDGCYYMRCVNCQAEWCWLCQKDWATHPDHFQCSTFNKGQDALSDKVEYLDPEEKKRRMKMGPVADRAAVYNDQDAAIKNIKSETEQKKRADVVTQLTELSRVNTKFIDTAVETLKYSHLFAFFLVLATGEHSVQAALLESLQDGLQMFVERINSALSVPPVKIDPALIRRLCTSALKTRENMLEAFVGMNDILDLETAVQKMMEKDQEKEGKEKEKEKEKEKKGKKGKKGEQPAPPQPVLVNPLYEMDDFF